MNTLMFIAAFLIIFTKFLDCWTTQRYMVHPTLEKNKLARKWMLKYGKEWVIWGIFAFAIFITALALFLVLYVYSGRGYQIIFLIMAVVISAAQFFVALANYQQKQNWFTRLLMKWNRYG